MMFLACDDARPSGPGAECPLNIALVQPSQPRLHIGDTLTMHATSWVTRPDCLPRDTTAAGLWWWADGEVAIDSKGHLTAVRPGLGSITLSQVGDYGALGQTDVGVYQPPGADSVVTIVRNYTADTAWVVLEDATGAVQRAQTVGAGASACWVTPSSDSVRYSLTVRPPPPPVGSDSTMVQWVPHSMMAFLHTWQLDVDSAIVQSVRTVTTELFARSPDPGTGC